MPNGHCSEMKRWLLISSLGIKTFIHCHALRCWNFLILFLWLPCVTWSTLFTTKALKWVSHIQAALINYDLFYVTGWIFPHKIGRLLHRQSVEVLFKWWAKGESDQGEVIDISRGITILPCSCSSRQGPRDWAVQRVCHALWTCELSL